MERSLDAIVVIRNEETSKVEHLYGAHFISSDKPVIAYPETMDAEYLASVVLGKEYSNDWLLYMLNQAEYQKRNYVCLWMNQKPYSEYLEGMFYYFAG